MRALVLAVVLLVPLAGCLHGVVPAGIPKATLDSNGWTLKDSRSETQAGFAKVEVRQYERSGLAAGGYATLSVVTVTDVPVVTSRAVSAVADDALGKANAKDDGEVEVDFSKAGAGKVTAKRFSVEQDGQEGKGFRAEFGCEDGYVLVVGLGADLPLAGATGSSMYDNALAMAKEVVCTGG